MVDGKDELAMDQLDAVSGGTKGRLVEVEITKPVTTIPAAQKTKNLAIFDHAHVTRIQSGADGRVTGVTYIRDRKEYFQPALSTKFPEVFLLP